MIRKTSIDAYNSILNSGTLGELKWSVYSYIYQNGPCTAKQVHLELRTEGQNDGCYTTRMSELRDAGLIFEIGTTRCEYTKREVMLWDVTDQMLPTKKNKREKLEQRKNQLISSLKKVIEQIKEIDIKVVKVLE